MNARSLLSSLNLTAKYNIFHRVWNAHAAELPSDRLNELYAIGRSLATTMNLSEPEVAFPGAWRFDLHGAVLEAIAQKSNRFEGGLL